ncbi:MAG TPA: lactate racemase domain-containing protein, partial [Mycobacteriales bacterium]
MTAVGGPRVVLSEDDVRTFVAAQLAELDVAGRSVCILVPDATRSCPLPLLLGAVYGALSGRASRVTTLVALGTHAPMSDAQLGAMLGYPAGGVQAVYPGMTVLNHEWWKPETFVSVGTIPAGRIGELSGGLLHTA